MRILLMFCLLAVGTTLCAEECSQLDILKAQRNGATFDVTLRVVDDRGVPVEGARCEGWKWIDAHKDNGSSYEAVTDSNGLARVTGKCGKWVSVAVSKEGYYSSQDEIRFNELKKQGVLGQYEWQPFGVMRTLVLKQIRNLGQLCVFPYSLRNCRIPEFNKWIGFDLEYSDWVAPHGKGINHDVLLRFSAEDRRSDDYRYTMDVSFTNNIYAGAYLMKLDKSSDCSTVYVADSNATYSASFTFSSDQTPGKQRHLDYLDSDSYLVFRTRTRVDKDGRLIGAHYGKIFSMVFLSSIKADIRSIIWVFSRKRRMGRCRIT